MVSAFMLSEEFFLKLANLFTELSISPEQNARLVPPHARKEHLSRGIDIDNFIPMSQEEMMAHLGVRYLALYHA